MNNIRIAGINYTIDSVDTSQMVTGGIGEADFNKQAIRINNNVTEQTKQIALVHEIVHMIDHAYGTNLTEQQVVIFSHGLVQFLKDNPNFFNEMLR